MRLTDQEYQSLLNRNKTVLSNAARAVVTVVKNKRDAVPRVETQKPVGVTTAQIYRLVLPVPPSVNTAFTTTSDGKRVYSKEAREYKARIKQIVCYTMTPFECAVELKIAFYRKSNQSDTSNRIKILEDSLTGFAYTDDKLVSKITIERFEDFANPRIEIEIIPRG